MAATAAAKPQATMVVQNGGVARYAETETRPKSDFLSPAPDEDFVDPEDDYNMPWEEPDRETGNDRMPVKEDGTFAAAIGLEVTGSAEFITDANILTQENTSTPGGTNYYPRGTYNYPSRKGYLLLPQEYLLVPPV